MRENSKSEQVSGTAPELELRQLWATRQVLADVGAVKNAIATAIASKSIQMMGTNAFEGIVNVAGTYIRFTGAFTPSGVVVSNVMGAALQK